MATDPLIYLDTNVFIAGFEGPPEIAAPVQNLLRALRGLRGVVVSSELTLAELLAPVRRPDALSTMERRQLYLNLLLRNIAIDLQPITRDILIKTADLRSMNGYKLADAIHLVTAVETSCAFFVSNDDRLRKLPAGLGKIRPDQAGVDELLRELSQ
ncbi:MAG: type II toxin-antitoxin system VapC family toxin [Methylocystis sp.]